jgi:UDP-N-acetylmuramoylalanine--D-glutamate ligase
MPNSSAMAERPNSPRRFEGRSVLVCGAGFAGASAARALLASGADVLITDARQTQATPALTDAGARFELGLTEVPTGTDLIVASPGWRPQQPLFANAATRGIEVIGEVELAWRLRGPDAAAWLAITGTNGKTTTVRMLESILQAAGLRARAVGNVGISIIDAVLEEPPLDVLAVELSSYQLHWPFTFAPAASVVLNLAPDHLDWHSSMADYARIKARIWNTPVAVGNRDDPQVTALLDAVMAGPGAPGVRVDFTLGEPAEAQLGVRDSILVDRAFGSGIELLPAAEVRPAGRHNVANALAASALARAYGVDATAVAAGLRAFVPDPHRNQLIATVDGVAFVDDSKATNPHAATASLSSYQRIVWIAGGQLKGAPVDEFVASIAGRLVAAVLLGVDREQLRAALARHAPDLPVIEVALTDDRAMPEVVRTAAVFARPGDTVVLAPAAASYDMFSGYAARGAAFADAVAALSGPA